MVGCYCVVLWVVICDCVDLFAVSLLGLRIVVVLVTVVLCVCCVSKFCVL